MCSPSENPPLESRPRRLIRPRPDFGTIKQLVFPRCTYVVNKRCTLLFFCYYVHLRCRLADVMGRQQRWCSVCRKLVINHRRHWIRQHQSLPYHRPTTPPATTAATTTRKGDLPRPTKEGRDEVRRSPPGQSPPRHRTPPSPRDDALLVPKTPRFTSVASDDEEWLQEPQCSVLPPGDEAPTIAPCGPPPGVIPQPACRDVAAQADGDEWVRTRPRKINLIHFPTLHVVPPESTVIVNRRDIATQADGSADARGRTTRALFGRTPHLHVVKPKGSPDIDLHYFTAEQAFAERTPDNHRRRLCDCQSCISHALRLRNIAYPCEAPATPGIVFMRLPGL